MIVLADVILHKNGTYTSSSKKFLTYLRNNSEYSSFLFFIQKFRFCGEQDCPDWILAETAVLSRLSSVRMKLVAKLVIGSLLGQPMNYEKLNKYTTSSRVQFASADTKAMIAALTFIYSNATRFDVAEDVLLAELEQLGLPIDIAKSMTKTFTAYVSELKEYFAKQTLRLPTISDVSWRVDYIMASSLAGEVDGFSVRVNLQTDKVVEGQPKDVSFETSVDKLAVLVNELKQAKLLMTSLSS